MKKNFIDKSKTYYTEKRWHHIEGMLHLLDDVKKIYHLSDNLYNDLKIAILLHDTGKKFDSEYNKYPYSGIIHSRISYKIAMHDFGIKDRVILNAILFHPTGKAKMSTLEKFLYVIDFSEYNRKFSKAKKIRGLLLEKKLTESLLCSSKMKLDYIKSTEQAIHPNTIEMVKYYEKIY